VHAAQALPGGAGGGPSPLPPSMQRAVSFLSGFLSDFDIEDPDHNLAGFGDGEVRAPPARPDVAPIEDSSLRRAEAVCDDAASTVSFDDVFAPDCCPRGSVHGVPSNGSENGTAADNNRWSTDPHRHSDTRALVQGRDSPCANSPLSSTTGTAHDDDDARQQIPSTRSMSTINGTAPRSGWLVWLKQRWSPLKEDNVKVLMQQDRAASQSLLERYLTEQTHMHEVAQAELIKRESQLEDGPPILDFSHDLSSAGVSAQFEVSVCGHEDGDRDDDEVLSNNGGDTSQSDGDDSKHKRQSGLTLSEASTTRKQYCQSQDPKHHSPMQVEATTGRQRTSFFGMRKSGSRIESRCVSAVDMDGLEELWRASNAYADSWSSPVVHKGTGTAGAGASCKQQ